MVHEIKEIRHFREALNEIHYDTWLILDLDNTVMKPHLELGGDPWFGGLHKHFVQRNIEPSIAMPWVMSVYNAIQHFIRTTPVEPEIVIIIKALQDIGVPVIGLTARGYAIRHQTLRQLADMGVDFSRNTITQNDDSSCEGGVIFCNGKNKGERLDLLFAQLGCKPKHVAMLDDKMEHLKHVKHTLETLEVNFSGFRYGYLDEQVKQFDMTMANLQLSHLWRWLPLAVQESIKKLNLIPAHFMGAQSPTDYARYFFHPEHPLLPATQEEQPKLVTRSMSSLSFFNQRSKANENDFPMLSQTQGY